MESLPESYEKYNTEIRCLKKQINAEKGSHQNSLHQLQNAYQIIDEIRETLRIEQTNNLKLKADLNDRDNRILTLSAQYEDQIEDIKQMIAAKDGELRRLSSVLMVTDYDMIRLKVINEL